MSESTLTSGQYGVKIHFENFSETPINLLAVDIEYKGEVTTVYANDVRPEQDEFALLVFNTGNNKGTKFTATATDRAPDSQVWKMASNETVYVKAWDDRLKITKEA